MLTQRIKVSSSTYLAPPIVNMVQNDSGRVLVCEPFDYQITGAETATLICRRPDDTIFTYTGTVNAADNDVSIPMATEGGALTQVGDVDAELILTASGSTITSFKITIRVQEDISGEATPEEKTFVAQLVAEVDASFAEYQAALNDVEGQLDDLVPKTTKVNGKALSGDITLNPSDIGAVPETRTVNGHALDSNVELDADDVGAVPEERTVNNYSLDDDVNVMAVDVPFTPNGSLTSDNVQDAIDEVRDMIEVGHEVELYNGNTTAIAEGTYALDDDVANYEYLDVWIGYNGRYSIQRVPAREDITFSFRIPNISNGTSTFLYVAEIDLVFSGSTMSVTNVGAWKQGNGSTYGPTRSQDPEIYIEKIYGIKYDAYGSGGGGSTIVVDDQLSPNSTNPVQNKVIYDALGNAGLSNAAKIALLNCFANVAWIGDDGQDYYDALYDALYPETPPAQLVSITAAFDQTGVTIYDTDTLDDLKPYLTVTAEYDDSTTEEVTNYVLSGTLTIGTSTITVSYGGMSDTFSVTVTDSKSWTLTRGVDNSGVGAIVYISDPTTTRGIYASATGEHPLYQRESGSSIPTDYYPIEIPDGATGLKLTTGANVYVGAISCNYTTQWYAINKYSWVASNSVYNFAFGSGATHYAVYIKHGSAGTAAVTQADADNVTIEYY